MLTLSLIFEPAASFVPGFGFVEITRPFLTVAENALVTVPTEQCACLIARLAARSVLPFTLGTTHRTNLAVAARSALIVSVQVPMPEQAPDQPANLDPAEAVAVSVTGTAAKGAEHVEPQLIPAGLDVTEPEPLPVLATFRVLPR